MKWSCKIGRYLGIDVNVHLTFVLLLAFVGFSNWMVDHSIHAAVSGVAFFLGLFLCVLLHEFGHALTARLYGIRTVNITLLPIGGVARLERMPEKPSQELCVALAGPAVNVVIACVLGAWLTFTGGWQPVSELGMASGGLVERLFAANIMLVIFNLLPAFPMDGGRVLRALLAMKMPHARATRVAGGIGKGAALVMGGIGFFYSPMLVFVALFVWLGATQETAAAEMKSTLAGVPVRDAMLTNYASLRPDTPLFDVADLLIAGSQQDFPVMDDGRIVGVVTREDVFRTIRTRGDHTFAETIMRTDFHVAHPDDLLEDVIARSSDSGCSMVIVVSNRRPLGLLTAENISEVFMLRSAKIFRKEDAAAGALLPGI